MKRFAEIFVVAVSTLASGCADPVVRQQDLDLWVGMPVAALDAQPLFVTISMIRTVTDSGIEVRNYASGRDFASCTRLGSAITRGAYVSAEAFANCSSGWAGCNNIFHIKEGKVLDYSPAGRCFTNESVWPTARYLRAKVASGG